MTPVYKIVTAEEWRDAAAHGLFAGSQVDLDDGFIHFSGADTVVDTLRLHFAGARGLVLAAFDADALGPRLRWEPSRGGSLFPHLYGALDPALALFVRPIDEDGDGGHILPELAP